MARISLSGAQVIVFMEKCFILVDRLECTSECNFEVEQKGGQAPAPRPLFGYNPGHDLKPLERTQLLPCRMSNLEITLVGMLQVLITLKLVTLNNA